MLNHTTFQLLRVRPRDGRAVVVRPLGPARDRGRRWRWSAAAAASATDTPCCGSTTRRGGGQLRVRLPRPGRFQRITAVLVNADARARGFDVGLLDWSYLTDGLPFEVSGRRDSAPTGAAPLLEVGAFCFFAFAFFLAGAVAMTSSVAASRSRAKLSRSAIAS